MIPGAARHCDRMTPFPPRLVAAILRCASVGGASAALAACSGATAGPAPATSAPATAGYTLTLAGDASPTPVGEPIDVELTVANHEPRSASVLVELRLVDPDGTETAFHRSRMFVPFGESVSEPVALTPARWTASTGRFTVRAELLEPQADAHAEVQFEVAPTERTVPLFEDATRAAGLETSVPVPACGQFANGAAWGDVDGDGWPDLAVTRLGDPVQLFVNRADGTFADESARLGPPVRGANGAAFADYDDDGDPDLVLVGDGADVLLRNDGTGAFTDVTADAGIAGDPAHRGMSAAWGDFDGDGLLDLYVTNYMRCTGPWTTEEEVISNVEYHPDVLYRNAGDGTFDDVTELLPGSDRTAAGFTAAWLDADADGRPDLYLANDFVGLSPDHNRLWHNLGDEASSAEFADQSLESGAGLYMNTMGVGIGDVDRDGDFDLALSNIAGNKLLRSNGDGTFVEELASGIERPHQGIEHVSVTWGTVVADLDLDGWEDVFMAAGNLEQGPAVVIGEQPNMLFLNDGTGTRFLDVSALTGTDATGESKGVAAADYDRDGDLDLFVVDQGGAPRLYRNVTPRAGRHWLELDLTGTTSNRDACGARVVVSTGATPIERLVQCGSGGTGSAHDRLVHVGLGAATTVERVEITWPSGASQELVGVPVDQVVAVTETP